MKQLHKVRNLPTQFQEKLQGSNIRVHVVGDALFATRIETPVVDYRYASRENEEAHLLPEQLPEHIQNQCFHISQVLHLPLCGIDLFLTIDGTYYCFEVNPSPGFSYYQANTGQDIASAIVRYLEYGKCKD
jgi:glutathione synthase/RimK-type ligase-like ATP-grasp enzyme